MIEQVFNKMPDLVYKIDYPNYLSQGDIDFILNGWAGNQYSASPDRQTIANNIMQQDVDDVVRGTEQALEQGADSNTAYNTVNSFYPRYVTPEDSLEVAAVENMQNDALTNDDITYNNEQDPESDTYDTTDFLTRNLLYAEYDKAVDDSLPKDEWGIAKFVGQGVLSGFQFDDLAITDIKNAFPNIDWKDAKTWNDMKDAFRAETDRQIEQGTFTPFIKDVQNKTLGIENSYYRDAVRRMVVGGRLDDWANGWAVFGPVVGGVSAGITARRAAQIGGNISKAAKLAVENGENAEHVSSFAKKMVAETDTLKTNANNSIITNSLKNTANDKKVQRIVDLYHNEMPQVVSEEDVKQVIDRTYNTDFNRHYVDVTNMEQKGNNIEATVLIGNGVDNQAATTKRGVANLAKELGIKDYKAVKKDGAGYYLQTTIKEPGQLGELSTKEFGTNAFGRMFGGSSIMPDWFHTELLAGYRKASKMEETLFKEYQKSAKYLKPVEKIQLNEIYLTGQRANNGRGAWINVNKMYEDGDISKRVRDAYNNFRKVNDMDYMISNNNTWNKLNSAGYVSDLEDDIVKPIKEGMLKTPNYSQMVIKNGDQMITATTHSAQQVEEILKNSGNVLVEVAPISVKGNALPYTHKILPKSKLTDKLKRTVLPYRAGGRRKYAYGTNFLKIGQTMQLNGEKVNAYSRIIGATANEKLARETAEEFNRALGYIERMVESGDTAGVAAELVRNPFKYINVSNTDDLKKLGGGLDYTQRVQVLKEGESMVYNNGLRTLYEDPLDYDTAFAEMALVQGNFYSKRGSVLTDFLGKEAKLMDIQDMFDQVVKRASTNNALGSLYEGMGKLFKDKYIEFIDTNAIRNPRTLSGVDLLRYGKLKEFSEVNSIHHQALREAKNMQLIYKRMANVPTDYDRAVNSTMKAATNVIAKTHVLNERQLAWLANNDPFTFGRALLFQTTMGMFNLKQLWAQGMGAISMGLAHPLLLSRALISAPVIIAGYLSRESTVMRNVFKGLAKPFGIGGKTFDDIMRYFEEYGTTMGTYRSPMTEVIHTRKWLDVTGQVLRWPVEWGTNYANIVNDLAAFFEAGGKNWKKIAARADDFAMNQTRATRSAFQAGQYLPTKTIAQFTSWPHRVLESAFNKRLTKRERIGIMMGQVALWGAVATTISDPNLQMNANIKLRENLQFLPESWKNLFIDGIIKSYLVEEGLYAQEGIGGAGVFDIAYTLYKSFTDKDMDSVDVEIPGGFKAPTRMMTALKSAAWLAGIGLDETDEYTPYHVAKKIVMEKDAPSGLRNVSRFILGNYYHEAYSTNGRMITDDVTPEQARGLILGFSLSESAQAQALYLIHNNAEKAIGDFYDDMVGKYVKGWNPGDADEVKREKLNRIREGLSTVLDFAVKTYGQDGRRILRRKHQSVMRQLNMTGVKQNEIYSKTSNSDIQQDILRTHLKLTGVE